MSKSPAFQFYAAEFLADENVAVMSMAGRGAYITLLCFCWREGSIPADPEKIARLCGNDFKPDLWPMISPCFCAHPTISGRLVNPRLDREREKQKSFREKRAEAGVLGAASKWGDGMPNKTPGIKRSERLTLARQKATHSADEWEVMLEVCGDKCLKCGSEEVKLVKDHIIPIYKDGSDGIENIQPLCIRCNSQKGPDTTDHRPEDWKYSLEQCLTKRLANAYQMPNSSSSSSSTSSSTSVKSKALSGKPDPTPSVLRKINGNAQFIPDAQSVMEYLNKNAGKGFEFKNRVGGLTASAERIIARLKQGYTAMELREVVFAKCAQWKDDEKMAEYLRPATLFSKENFEQYLGEIKGGSHG